MKISVTNSDIRNGSSVSTGCPVARAVNKVLAEGSMTAAYASCIHIFRPSGGASHAMDVPKKVGQFVRDFDNGNKPKPFSFCIRIPQRLLK